MHAGRIKAVWIMATNPVVSLPRCRPGARGRSNGASWVVVSDCIAATDTTALADVLLPAAAWGEKDGTVTNSERRHLPARRAFLPLPAEAKPELVDHQRSLPSAWGLPGVFEYPSTQEIFEEHAPAFRYGQPW